MENKFLKKIAVVQMWPEIQAAEDEVIARIVNTCDLMGIEVLLIDTAGYILSENGKKITSKDVDFVIHLHFETPKTYDAFSFVTLWNPLKFYFDWGYRKHSLNIISHDDFLSCDSLSADQHVERFILDDPSHLKPSVNLFHSLSTPICEPSLGARKLFYVGINWEKLGKGAGRHDNLLRTLDDSGNLVIYGPKVFLGVKVWDGFKSYVGPLPFDGVSVIEAIHQAGIALVLSSADHIESEIMSSRLFESLAAGVIIIADENEFARKNFGDTLLYIKTQDVSAEDITSQVKAHIAWIKTNPEKVLKMIKKAQRIFKDKFEMSLSFQNIYKQLPKRKALLAEQYLHKSNDYSITLVGMLGVYSKKKLSSLLDNFYAQTYSRKSLLLVVDERDLLENKKVYDKVFKKYKDVSLISVDLFRQDMNGTHIQKAKLGKVLSQIIENLPEDELVSILYGGEVVFSDHYSSLVRKFEDNPSLEIAYSNLLLTHKDEAQKAHFRLIGDVKTFNPDYNQPNGYSRFLFKVNKSPWADVTIKYLGWGVVDAIYSRSKNRAQVSRASCVLDVQNLPYQPDVMDDLQVDMSILIDTMTAQEKKTFSEESYDQDLLRSIVERKIKFSEYSYSERLEIIAKLVEALQLPSWIMACLRRVYWFFRK